MTALRLPAIVGCTMILREAVRQKARELGFDLIGITGPGPSGHSALYRQWLARGYHAGMGYLARPDAVERRADPRILMPEVRSIVVVGLNYYPGEFRALTVGAGLVSRYAWGADYHDVMMEKLEGLASAVQGMVGRAVAHRAYVDFGALMERELANRAGLGWFGKNAMLIHPRTGSYLFLGELLLDVALTLDRDVPADRCGTCTACLDACPTGALVEPGVIDARRCISYLTIEHRGIIPEALRPRIGDWVFGCDVCQEVCPWNQRFAHIADASILRPSHSVLDLAEVLSLDDAAFRDRFRDTPLWRTKRSGLLRNAAIVLGNQHAAFAVPALRRASRDADPLIREHAVWALSQIG